MWACAWIHHVITLQHINISVVCYGEDVGRHLGTSFASVHVDDLFSIDREVPVGIDDHAKQARIGLKV